MNHISIVQATLEDTDTTKNVNVFGFNGMDPIKPYPLDKINVGPGSFSSRLNARKIPLFQYLFMLDPTKKKKKYGGDNL